MLDLRQASFGNPFLHRQGRRKPSAPTEIILIGSYIAAHKLIIVEAVRYFRMIGESLCCAAIWTVM
jgi:hypothetical protein